MILLSDNYGGGSDLPGSLVPCLNGAYSKGYGEPEISFSGDYSKGDFIWWDNLTGVCGTIVEIDDLAGEDIHHPKGQLVNLWAYDTVVTSTITVGAFVMDDGQGGRYVQVGSLERSNINMNRTLGDDSVIVPIIDQATQDPVAMINSSITIDLYPGVATGKYIISVLIFDIFGTYLSGMPPATLQLYIVEEGSDGVYTQSYHGAIYGSTSVSTGRSFYLGFSHSLTVTTTNNSTIVAALQDVVGSTSNSGTGVGDFVFGVIANLDNMDSFMGWDLRATREYQVTPGFPYPAQQHTLVSGAHGGEFLVYGNYLGGTMARIRVPEVDESGVFQPLSSIYEYPSGGTNLTLIGDALDYTHVNTSEVHSSGLYLVAYEMMSGTASVREAYIKPYWLDWTSLQFNGAPEEVAPWGANGYSHSTYPVDQWEESGDNFQYGGNMIALDEAGENFLLLVPKSVYTNEQRVYKGTYNHVSGDEIIVDPNYRTIVMHPYKGSTIKYTQAGYIICSFNPPIDPDASGGYTTLSIFHTDTARKPVLIGVCDEDVTNATQIAISTGGSLAPYYSDLISGVTYYKSAQNAPLALITDPLVSGAMEVGRAVSSDTILIKES
jgi:hypothetical protein